MSHFLKRTYIKNKGKLLFFFLGHPASVGRGQFVEKKKKILKMYIAISDEVE